jgi:hypothetical protein
MVFNQIEHFTLINNSSFSHLCIIIFFIMDEIIYFLSIIISVFNYIFWFIMFLFTMKNYQKKFTCSYYVFK